MNIVDFYKKLSRILEMCREGSISHATAEFKLKQLLAEADQSKLEVEISDKILDMKNLTKYDDEHSFEESSFESSFEEGEESSY